MTRVLCLVALAACSFQHGTVPNGNADADVPVDGEPPDAMPDAAVCQATAIAASSAHTCVALTDGSVRCWGKNGQGEVGVAVAASDACMIGNSSFACVKSPADPLVPVAVDTLGLGDQHSCAIGGSKVYCWGANDAGQFGNGDAGDSASPVEVVARTGATAIGGGSQHTCSIAAGTVSCSGVNAQGEVGDGSTMPRYMPVTARTGATAFGIGYLNGYAIIDGDVWGWGHNDLRQLDNSGMDPRPTPIKINGTSGAVAVAGGAAHACAILGDDSAVCWGSNSEGQLGRITVSVAEGPAPVTVTTGIVELAAGADHTCARRSDASVFCWGENYPAEGMQIVLPGPARQIASGSYHDCALLDDGTAWCWGWNAYGQYGDGTSSAAIANTPVRAQICP